MIVRTTDRTMGIQNIKRAFAILEMLEEETNDEHGLTTNQIRARLDHRGNGAVAQSVFACIRTLQELGFQIDCNKTSGNCNTYRLVRRDWSREEIELLADAIKASRYISRKDMKRLLDKVGALVSKYDRDGLTGSTFVGGRRQDADNNWLENVAKIRSALAEDIGIAFQYVEYDADAIAHFKHDGKVYRVKPLALAYSADTYYLLATEDGAKAKTFRSDRMSSVKTTPVDFDVEEDLANFDMEKLTERSFKMYMANDQRDVRVELRVTGNAISSVIDYFKDRRSCGMACAAQEDGSMSIKVTVQPSPTFYGWIAQYMGKVTPLGPKKVVGGYREGLQQLVSEC